jgi:hypothetical protein
VRAVLEVNAIDTTVERRRSGKRRRYACAAPRRMKTDGCPNIVEYFVRENKKIDFVAPLLDSKLPSRQEKVVAFDE